MPGSLSSPGCGPKRAGTPPFDRRGKRKFATRFETTPTLQVHPSRWAHPSYHDTWSNFQSPAKHSQRIAQSIPFSSSVRFCHSDHSRHLMGNSQQTYRRIAEVVNEILPRTCLKLGELWVLEQQILDGRHSSNLRCICCFGDVEEYKEWVALSQNITCRVKHDLPGTAFVSKEIIIQNSFEGSSDVRAFMAQKVGVQAAMAYCLRESCLNGVVICLYSPTNNLSLTTCEEVISTVQRQLGTTSSQFEEDTTQFLQSNVPRANHRISDASWTVPDSFQRLSHGHHHSNGAVYPELYGPFLEHPTGYFQPHGPPPFQVSSGPSYLGSLSYPGVTSMGCPPLWGHFTATSSLPWQDSQLLPLHPPSYAECPPCGMPSTGNANKTSITEKHSTPSTLPVQDTDPSVRPGQPKTEPNDPPMKNPSAAICLLCDKPIPRRMKYCRAHSAAKRCQQEGCEKCAQGGTKFCISHGGGRRCKYEGCTKAARDKYFCAGHGGGKRCQAESCAKGAVGKSHFCTAHGGGRRCQYPKCSKGSHLQSQFCTRHDKLMRCTVEGCPSYSASDSIYCQAHSQ